MQQGPKVVVIGAGSYFFGKPVIYNMVTSPVLREGTLALVDTDPKVLETMLNLARRAVEHTGVPLKIEGSVDRREVLSDANFVVNSFSCRNAYYRGLDTRIALKYGVTMCSSDTIGPGGIFRALRELPEVLRIARDVQELASDAWIINFVNPASTLGIGLMRHAPNVKSFALCDGNHMPYAHAGYLQLAGVLDEGVRTVPDSLKGRYDLRIAGVNHFTWLFKLTLDGKDLMPDVYKNVCRMATAEYETRPSSKAKPRLNMNYTKELMELYGAYPTAASHTKEYVPFFQGIGVTPNSPEPLLAFDAYNRAEEMESAWQITRKYADGELPIEKFIAEGCGDHATDIIESMWGNLGKRFYINGPNRGAVTNMPSDAFLELLCDLDGNGPHPLPMGELPRGLLGREMQVLDSHELTAEAAVSCDRQLLLRAMMTDPLMCNIGDAKLIMKELLEAERTYLPAEWFR